MQDWGIHENLQELSFLFEIEDHSTTTPCHILPFDWSGTFSFNCLKIYDKKINKLRNWMKTMQIAKKLLISTYFNIYAKKGYVRELNIPQVFSWT